MNRLEELFKKLDYTRENGLFYLEEADTWMNKFPYRIGRVLRDIIKPYSFYCPYSGPSTSNPDHPEPLNNFMILFFDNPSEEVRKRIPNWTFNFSQAPIVIINRDESLLEIYHGFAFDQDQKWLQRIDSADIDIEIDLSWINVITGKTWEKLYNKYFKNAEKVDKYLLKNLTDARRILIDQNNMDTGGLSPITSIRLIGRALFIRYLIDRDVHIENNDVFTGNKLERQKNFENLLKDKEKTYCLFTFISEKFNGDLFPIIEVDDNGQRIYDEEKEVKITHLEVLYNLFSCSALFHDAQMVQNYFVQKSLFNLYDFAIIPVELISNIYENFLDESRASHLTNTSPSKQKEIKAYYTPSFLVDYVLSQTVIPHLENQTSASCKVLDPACGSGIFLVETLRKIIEKEKQVNPLYGPKNEVMVPDKRIWQLVRENIFGIDIDSEAIEIAIFSIYITVLDYKTPKEIGSFRFESLKNNNLFGGTTADFFNERHPFNQKFKTEVALDFIIGNPPWGKVEKSRYIEYIDHRDLTERKNIPANKYIKLEIGNKEISQAFMVRTSDFLKPEKRVKCIMIVTGKNFYNTSPSVKNWRNYFLNTFHITQVLELTSIQNKIVGGETVFQHADQSAVVISFFPAAENENTATTPIKHIVVRPNWPFIYLKTVVIERQDVKKVLQKYFMESRGGYDWLWKVLLHGNILDFHFIKRLKAPDQFKTLWDLIKEYHLEYKGGLKQKDGAQQKSIEDIIEWSYLDPDQFLPYRAFPSTHLKEKMAVWRTEGKVSTTDNVGYVPDTYFFEGKKLLIKKGLQAGDDFKAVSAFSDGNLTFSSTICSVKTQKGSPLTPEVENILKGLVALINSKICTYFLLATGSSLGVDRTRAVFEEFFSIPVSLNSKIIDLTQQIQEMYQQKTTSPSTKDLTRQLVKCEKALWEEMMKVYHIDEQEQALIDYAVEVAIPVLKREKFRKGDFSNIFAPLSCAVSDDKEYLTQYAQVFVQHFGKIFDHEEKYFKVEIHVTLHFIGFHFIVAPKTSATQRVSFIKDTASEEMITKIASLGIHSVSRDFYAQQDIRGFNKDSFYVIKVNQRKFWHKATAFADLSDFISSLVSTETKKNNTGQ